MRVFAVIVLMICLTTPAFAVSDPARQAAESRGTVPPVDGPWNVYDKNGKLLRQENYRSFVLHGEVRAFYPSGAVKDFSVYEAGQRHGLNKTYYENGGLKSEGVYVNNNFEGLVKMYQDTGELLSEANFINGSLDGEKKEYFKSGALNTLSNYNHGILNGAVVTYDEKGKIISEAKYNHGELTGRRDYSSEKYISVPAATKPQDKKPIEKAKAEVPTKEQNPQVKK